MVELVGTTKKYKRLSQRAYKKFERRDSIVSSGTINWNWVVFGEGKKHSNVVVTANKCVADLTQEGKKYVTGFSILAIAMTTLAVSLAQILH